MENKILKTAYCPHCKRQVEVDVWSMPALIRSFPGEKIIYDSVEAHCPYCRNLVQSEYVVNQSVILYFNAVLTRLMYGPGVQFDNGYSYLPDLPEV